jgi:hypothetical protein
MKRRLTGLSIPWFGIQWERVPGDKEIAQRVITLLEDRRLLFKKHGEIGGECIKSANIVRDFLTNELNSNSPGPELAATLRAMRAACREFVDAGGPDGRSFGESQRRMFLPLSYYRSGNSIALALGRLRSLIGTHVAALALQYDLVVEGELARALPPVPDSEDGRDLDLSLPRRRKWLRGRNSA